MKQTYKYISTEIIEFFRLPLCQFITFNIDDIIYRYDFINSDETNDFMEKICNENNVEKIAGNTIYVKCNMDTDIFESFANYENTNEEMFIHQRWLNTRPPYLTSRDIDKDDPIIPEHKPDPNCVQFDNDPVNHPNCSSSFKEKVGEQNIRRSKVEAGIIVSTICNYRYSRGTLEMALDYGFGKKTLFIEKQSLDFFLNNILCPRIHLLDSPLLVEFLKGEIVALHSMNHCHTLKINSQQATTGYDTGKNDPIIVAQELDLDYTQPDNDPVNHPNHYTQGGIECIDYLKPKLTDAEFMGFLRGNVIKYLSRAELKNSIQDYKKARWYLDRLIKLHDGFKKGI